MKTRILAAILAVTLGVCAEAQVIRVFVSGGSAGGGSGATPALDNLASVAINTSLISDTNNTDDLGSAGIAWATAWANAVKSGTGTTLAISGTAPAAPVNGATAGTAVTITASAATPNAGAGTDGAAAGGSVTITAGAAARDTSGNANGGDINLTPGAGIGTGTAGQIVTAVAGTVAKPVWSIFSGGVHQGFYSSSAANIDVGINSNHIFEFSGVNVNQQAGGQHRWTNTTNSLSANADTGLARNAAGVIRSTNGSTGITGFLGGGAAVASATALPVPTGRVFHVTGTTTVTSITSTNFLTGAVITLIFDDALTFTDGSNLKLAGDFVTTADDTITLVYDGTSWFETDRSVN